MASKPTARSLDKLRKDGWLAQVVEKWIPHTKRRLDLFGCIDIIALDGKPGALGIQATSGSNVASRITKALAEPKLRSWLEAGNRFEVWGWVKRKVKRGGKAMRWELRTEPITLDALEVE